MISTDPQDEEFDLLDAYGHPLGVRKRRGDVHRDGDWHAAMHLWVGGVGAGGPFVLFQRRSLTKDTCPGFLDVAVGGHLRAGESFAETAREAEEEIGLAVGLESLVRIGRRFMGQPGDRDRELQEVFAVRSDLPLAAYVLHPEEVDGIAAAGLEAALALFRRETDEIAATEVARDGRTRRASMRVADFAGHDREAYAILALEGLAAVVAGHDPVPFEIRDAPPG